MRHVTDKIVSASDASCTHFNRECDELCAQGFIPDGQLIVVYASGLYPTIAQAFVRHENGDAKK